MQKTQPALLRYHYYNNNNKWVKLQAGVPNRWSTLCSLQKQWFLVTKFYLLVTVSPGFEGTKKVAEKKGSPSWLSSPGPMIDRLSPQNNHEIIGRGLG